MLFTPPLLFASKRVYTTWDPTTRIGAGITLSNANLTAAGGADSHRAVGSLIGVDIANSSAYWETLVNAIGSTAFPGIANSSYNFTASGASLGQDANTWGYDSQGRVYAQGVIQATYSTYTAGDRIMWAIKNGSLWVGKTGTWQNSGNPGAGTGAVITGLTGTMYAGWSDNVSGMNVTANFGASAFTYTVPSGFNAGIYT